MKLLEGLIQDDCPEDSFAPLLATQETDRPTAPTVPIIPGLPLIMDNVPQTQEYYEVERVLRGKFKDNELQYLVKWKGFPNSINSWVLEKNLNDELVDFIKSHPVKITGKI